MLFWLLQFNKTFAMFRKKKWKNDSLQKGGETPFFNIIIAILLTSNCVKKKKMIFFYENLKRHFLATKNILAKMRPLQNIEDVQKRKW
jgi:hypothetical protein